MIKAELRKPLTQRPMQFLRDTTQDLHIIAIDCGMKEMR